VKWVTIADVLSQADGGRDLKGMTDNNTTNKVVVIGGGYAGTLAANHLRMRGDVDITLVNPRPRFVQRIRLHQLVAGTGDATADYGTLLGAGIRLVVDTATRIDSVTRTVQLASSSALDYDYVIYAVGSTGTLPASVPGAAEFAYSVAEFEHALRLRDALDNQDPDAPVTVVGAGLTGIEAATELAEQGRRVTLVCGGQLGPSLSGPGRRSVAKVLARLGVAVLENDVVTEVRPMRWSSPTARYDRARSRYGRPGSVCRTLRPTAACAPTPWAGCSPTKRWPASTTHASSPQATALPRRARRCGCAAHPPPNSVPRPPTRC
jgi:NADPH-dependent 2,4-dienoyl-CoA reductase/sulfur reductase-like enzyme